MEFQKVLETRRSVRKYDPNVSVTREQMEELIRAAQEAPSKTPRPAVITVFYPKK